MHHGLHGLLIGIFITCTDLEKHALAAELLGERTEGLSVREAAMRLPEAIIKLVRDINFPNGLKDLGFTEDDIPLLVEGTLKQQRILSCSPRPVTAKAPEEIFRDSMKFW